MYSENSFAHVLVILLLFVFFSLVVIIIEPDTAILLVVLMLLFVFAIINYVDWSDGMIIVLIDVDRRWLKRDGNEIFILIISKIVLNTNKKNLGLISVNIAFCDLICANHALINTNKKARLIYHE